MAVTTCSIPCIWLGVSAVCNALILLILPWSAQVTSIAYVQQAMGQRQSHSHRQVSSTGVGQGAQAQVMEVGFRVWPAGVVAGIHERRQRRQLLPAAGAAGAHVPELRHAGRLLKHVHRAVAQLVGPRPCRRPQHPGRAMPQASAIASATQVTPCVPEP